MRGLTISAHGGPEQLQLREDLPAPEVRAATDVRVRVAAAALNHLDLFVLEGLPGITLTPPWIVAADAVGTVDQVGRGGRLRRRGLGCRGGRGRARRRRRLG